MEAWWCIYVSINWIVFGLSNAKPLLKPMVTYYVMDPWKHIKGCLKKSFHEDVVTDVCKMAAIIIRAAFTNINWL